MTDPQVYFHSDDHAHTIDRLEVVARTFDPAAPDDLRSRIIEILGDLGIWPMGCFNGRDEGKVIVAV